MIRVSECSLCGENRDGITFLIEDGRRVLLCDDCNARLKKTEHTEILGTRENIIGYYISMLRRQLSPINKKLSFIFSINQIPKDKVIYYANLSEFMKTLKAYEQYMLKNIIELFHKDWEIDGDELFEKEKFKDILKHSLLDLFGGDPTKLMNWTQENFPKFHSEVMDNIEKELGKNSNDNSKDNTNI